MDMLRSVSKQLTNCVSAVEILKKPVYIFYVVKCILMCLPL